jgi:FlaA1/EpsC-like NDP-sugar epimerase
MSQDSIVEIVRAIEALAPPGAPADGPQLQEATQRLMRAYQAEGRLTQSPLAPALDRSVDLHEDRAEACLRGRRILVTGGAGCVGTRLLQVLQDFRPETVAVVDIAAEHHRVDIRDVDALDAVFAEVKPHVVFHLAGVREPARAEVVVRDAIETNVFGARNVIAACERHGVERAVYSSTGKCFAYTTRHVYTASKKLAELQWVLAARRMGNVAFTVTRFTHVIENGLVMQDIQRGIQAGLVELHGPDRHFNVQNLRQATRLLAMGRRTDSGRLPSWVGR